MSVEEAEDVVIELLAARHGVEAVALREDLQGRGQDMPVDSVVMVLVLTAVEARFGIRLSADEDTARSLGSVRDFSRTIAEASRKEG
ncbi:hypothetical protein [Catenulispora subtropica]|uniref:hypothetical protein n=1 Tax=Catenulispora subtropica TaxID=450798 RepID=UPI0031D3622A